jgi:predicted Zn-dependent peptidase
MVLLAEEMPWLESTAFALLLPAGSTRDPDDRRGLASFTCEMVQRGCGERDSRAFVEDLDRLGADRSATVSATHASYGAAVLARNLYPTLQIYADLVRVPLLPVDQLEDARQVCVHEIRSVADDPAHLCHEVVRRRHYPWPWGMPTQGELSAVEAMTIDDVRRFVTTHHRPQSAILSVAGRIDWPQLQSWAEELFGDWSVPAVSAVTARPPERGYEHVEQPSSQTHIALAYPSVPYRDQDYYQARGAIGVLSDGMSSRLFTEVRQKRGLCYSVYASYHSLKEEGAVFCYAGTQTERAQETLDVMLHELQRLTEGIDESELQRLKARVKSSLIMQQESSASRAMSMAGDWYHRGRLLSLETVSASIEALTVASINRYLAEHPPQDFSVATVGSRPLEVSKL